MRAVWGAGSMPVGGGAMTVCSDIWSNDHDLLRIIASGTAGSTGAQFFRDLTRNLAQALEVRFAFAAEFAGVHSRVRTLAFWDGEQHLDAFEYDLAHTPCEEVLSGMVRCYADDVAEQFPEHTELAHLGVRSYLAIPMLDSAGSVLGHLAAMDTRPMTRGDRDLTIFRIFGARAAAELERMGAEAALHASEARLSGVLAGAVDAIVILDRDLRVRLLNRAAARVFRCADEQVVGQAFARFLSPRLRQVITDLMQRTTADSQIWAPAGLSARRDDCTEFPVELTLSAVTVGQENLYTLILRDLTERAQAEARFEALKSEHADLREELSRRQVERGMVGQSPAMAALHRQVAQVAPTDATVLIHGETGTGKELVATAIHQGSARRERTLVVVNCAALPSELIESELFGHEKGSFTGATAARKGRFELAHGGTLFLDELGELSAAAQAKLLRALQGQGFERVGGTKTITVDVRVIAATNRGLAEMVKAGMFRADLYYRVNVFPIDLPPLRARREDIAVLAQYFLERAARRLGRTLERFSAVALDRLAGYGWPGNVRELQNIVERAAILAAGPVVEVDDRLLGAPELGPQSAVLSGTLEQVERGYILQVLEAQRWVIEGAKGAARQLGLKPSTLRYTMQRLGIQKPGVKEIA